MSLTQSFVELFARRRKEIAPKRTRTKESTEEDSMTSETDLDIEGVFAFLMDTIRVRVGQFEIPT